MASVVELRGCPSNNDAPVSYARLVLTSTGEVAVVPLGPSHPEGVVSLVEEGVPGPNGGRLRLEDGAEFLAALPGAFRGSYFWATPIFEMDEREALDPARSAP